MLLKIGPTQCVILTICQSVSAGNIGIIMRLETLFLVVSCMYITHSTYIHITYC